MKHVIIGTAGHVDHGKTLLIKALTGIDTDRLQEEKKRGITIELGFAHLDFDDGTQAGIVDVPGHEKFIKNMLAGAGGIDLAILVVAADEGFMPQTIEHLGILTLLGIRDGLVVITKTDMVEPEWVEMMYEEITERVKGTFLEGKPVFPVSAYTGEGIAELREKLREMVKAAAEKDLRTPFRLPVDRVFSVDGFGTVVTGTLVEGSMKVDDPAVLSPSGTETRIRNLQVHGKDVETAFAGQRVAVNLAGLKKTDIQRGDAVVKPGSVRAGLMMDVRLQNLPNSGRVILTDSQVHLYLGAAVGLCKVVLLDRTELHPGESCYAQLRLTSPMAAKKNDRFVIRFYSPLETIGGGVILDENAKKHKRNDPKVAELLAVKESGSSSQQLLQAMDELGLTLPDRQKVAEKLSADPEETAEQLAEALSEGKVLEPVAGRYLSASQLDKIWDSCQKLLDGYHKQNPLHEGMKIAEMRQKLLPKMDILPADAILALLAAEGKIRRVADRYALEGFAVQLTKRQSSIRSRMLKIYGDCGLEGPSQEELFSQFQPKEKEDCKQVLESLVSGGHLYLPAPGQIYGEKTFLSACGKVIEWFESHETLTLAEFRDLLGTSRKHALAILEYLDKNKMLKKEGDIRRMGQNPIPR